MFFDGYYAILAIFRFPLKVIPRARKKLGRKKYTEVKKSLFCSFVFIHLILSLIPSFVKSKKARKKSCLLLNPIISIFALRNVSFEVTGNHATLIYWIFDYIAFFVLLFFWIRYLRTKISHTDFPLGPSDET